jgi:biopolymer transport protein ExbD
MNLRDRRRDDDVEINLINLIDVLLFLVIFFMISTTFVKKSEIALTLPQASAEEKATDDNKIKIVIGADGQCFINDRALINMQLDTIEQGIAEAAKSMTNPAVIVSADAKATHQSVITVLDAARRLGLLKITFATELSHQEHPEAP